MRINLTVRGVLIDSSGCHVNLLTSSNECISIPCKQEIAKLLQLGTPLCLVTRDELLPQGGDCRNNGEDREMFNGDTWEKLPTYDQQFRTNSDNVDLRGQTVTLTATSFA
jgi:hypothetical protein